MSDTIRDAVREKYASVAQSGLSNEAGFRAVAEAFGYPFRQAGITVALR